MVSGETMWVWMWRDDRALSYRTAMFCPDDGCGDGALIGMAPANMGRISVGYGHAGGQQFECAECGKRSFVSDATLADRWAAIKTAEAADIAAAPFPVFASGLVVRVSVGAVSFTAKVLRYHRNRGDGFAMNGIVRATVTDAGTSGHRRDAVIDVSAVCLTVA